MQVEKLSETLHKITLSLNDFTVNLVASIGADGILLVDAGWNDTSEELGEKLKELNDGVIKLIIFTHQHGDHIGGMYHLGEKSVLISHKNTQYELAGKYYALDPLPGPEFPLIAVDDELSLRFNGEDIKVIPAPGHTSSDMVVHFIDSGIVCLGDLILSDMFPPIDMTRGGNVETYIENLTKLTGLFPSDTKFITGHGRDYTVDDLKAHHHMALSTTDLVRKGIDAGKTAQEMVKENVLKDWAKWDSSQVTGETWVTQAYVGLMGNATKSISEPLTHTIMESGIEAAIKQFHKLKKEQPDSYDFGENQLNLLGYQLLWREMTEAAIEVHKLNTWIYPESANPYDSLGEAYMANGNTKLAIESYEKALERNPDMLSAIEALKELKTEGL